MDQLTQNNALMVNRIANRGECLAKNAKTLEGMVGTFRLSSEAEHRQPDDTRGAA